MGEDIWLVAGGTDTAPRQHRPLAVCSAQVDGLPVLPCVVHTRACRLLDARHLRPRRCGGEMGERARDFRAGHVVHLGKYTER